MVAIKPLPETRTLLRNISWQTFKIMLAETGNQRHNRIAYESGTVEIMTPNRPPENSNRMIEVFIGVMCEELGIVLMPRKLLNPLQARSISWQELLEDLLELFEPTAEAAEIALTAQISEDVMVLGDGEQLHRLFANLLRNALQYTPQGGEVTVSLSASHRFCAVRITDTGLGIAPEKQALVFERFWRGDRSRSQPQQGTGLGLPIANAVAHQHRGKITLTSQVGVGSCFTVHLPTTKRDRPLML